MTGTQLKQWRLSMGLNQLDTAAKLSQIGECSGPTISRWESKEDEEIPKWAESALLNNTLVPLPLADLHRLLDLARSQDRSFTEILAEAIHLYVQAPAAKPNIIHVSYQDLAPPGEALDRVAEDPALPTTQITIPLSPADQDLHEAVQRANRAALKVVKEGK